MNDAKAYLPYLKTLRRIPAPIIQAMATREIRFNDPAACVCGWAIRESLAFANGQTADENADECDWDSDEQLLRTFGGTFDEWHDIYYGVTDDRRPAIEEAFARRVMECVR